MNVTINVPDEIADEVTQTARRVMIANFPREKKDIESKYAEQLAQRAIERALKRLIAWRGGGLQDRFVVEITRIMEEALGRGNVRPPQTGEDQDVQE